MLRSLFHYTDEKQEVIMENILKHQRKTPLDKRNPADRYNTRITIARRTTRTVNALSKRVSRDILAKTLELTDELVKSR